MKDFTKDVPYTCREPAGDLWGEDGFRLMCGAGARVHGFPRGEGGWLRVSSKKFEGGMLVVFTSEGNANVYAPLSVFGIRIPFRGKHTFYGVYPGMRDLACFPVGKPFDNYPVRVWIGPRPPVPGC